MAYQPKSYRKFLATSVTAAMVATVAAPFATPAQAAANFPDVPATHWAADAIDYLVEKGALEGRPNGTFDPAASITRGEAAKILAITLGLEVDLNAKTNFADAANHWASPYIAAIQEQTEDVINGYENGTFRPNNNITRQEMAKMVVTAYGLELNEEADVSFNDNTGWGAEYVSVLASLGIVEGISTGTFAPNGLVTRAQTPVFVQRTEVPEVRVEVPTKEPVVEVPAELAVSSVTAVNDTKLEVTFNKAVDADLAVEIEKSGKRFIAFHGGQTAKTSGVIQSSTISFNADRTVASVILDTIPNTDINYTVALIDGDNNQVASLVAQSTASVLKQGATQPEITVNAAQDKVILKFNEKMSAAALTNANYTVFENNTSLGLLTNFVTGAGQWVDSTAKTSVEFKLDKAALNKLLAGKTYRIQVAPAVETDRGTALSETQRTISVQTPAISEAQPVARIARVVSSTEIALTFDKDLAAPNFNASQVTVKTPSGQNVAVTGVTAGTNPKELLVTVSGTLDTDLTYTIDLPANGVANAVFPNASNKETVNLRAQAQADIEVRSVSARLVPQVDNKNKADLLLTFDQRVDVANFAGKTDGSVVIKDGGDTFTFTSNTSGVALYPGDTTGKTIIIKDVNASFADSGTAFVPEAGTTYEVELAVGAAKTDTGVKTNLEKLKTTLTGLSVAAPTLDKVRLESAERIVLEFKENIDASNLKASDITVKGYERYRGGNFSELINLRGDSQVKFTASGNTLTITPAVSDVKFATENVLDLVQIAADSIKSSGSGVENLALNTASVTANNVIDRAAPVMIGAVKNDADTLEITYSEAVALKGSDVPRSALQFTVENASKNAHGTFATVAADTILVDFSEVDTFKSDLDLSNVKVVYTKNATVTVQDTKGNEASSQTITGIK
ncbi:S-layer homology domain-containing protein [Halalkalibacter nanhaiisediminis]|uniref:S-layer family protein n=1 Tax=Halalkalibacter nanhaiisediminis TaxID=688079 RepID=A0A562QSU9_9BACI|nr:S-layer homology domain-containing protein [Halalkalibacter nanhaiisediminis]TWI59822.1 S-layer family protein [Halalkalibacter nanhaiisediminis]